MRTLQQEKEGTTFTFTEILAENSSEAFCESTYKNSETETHFVNIKPATQSLLPVQSPGTDCLGPI